MLVWHENEKYLKFMNDNSIIIDMIDRSSHDFQFRKQMEDAKPETKQFINSIIKTFEEVDLKIDLGSDKFF